MRLRGIVIDGTYNSLRLGEVVEVTNLSKTLVEFKGCKRGYRPSVLAYVDEEGHPITIQQAIFLTRRTR